LPESRPSNPQRRQGGFLAGDVTVNARTVDVRQALCRSLFDQFILVALPAGVRQDKAPGAIIHDIAQQFHTRVVAQVPMPTHYSLFQMPGALGIAQHLDVMVTFEDQGVAPPKLVPRELAGIPKIGGNTHLDSLPAEDEGDRVHGIVRDRKGLYLELIDFEWTSR